jgi:hypothetical protein
VVLLAVNTFVMAKKQAVKKAVKIIICEWCEKSPVRDNDPIFHCCVKCAEERNPDEPLRPLPNMLKINV